jgi:thioredoxin reductase
VLCTGGAGRIDAAERAQLESAGIAVESRPLVRFEREGEGVRLVFADGPVLSRRAVFFHLGCTMRSTFARDLGCELDEKGGIQVDKYEATCVPGLYVAGDASRDILLAIVAAGEGAAAAAAINSALCKEAFDD